MPVTPRRMRQKITHQHIPLMSELSHNWEAKLSTWYANDPESLLVTRWEWPDDPTGKSTHDWLWRQRRVWVDNGYTVSFDSRERVELGWKHKRVQLTIRKLGPRGNDGPDIDFKDYKPKR